MINFRKQILKILFLVFIDNLLFVESLYSLQNPWNERYSHSKLKNSHQFLNRSMSDQKEPSTVTQDLSHSAARITSVPANQLQQMTIPVEYNSSFPTNKLVKEMHEAGHLIENAELCPELGKNMKIMILVASALNNSRARTAIRQTWGYCSRYHNVGIGFVVGVHSQLSSNAIIRREQRTYGDLIQARFVDFYGNLTLKTVSILEWVDTYCSQVPFVLKTDDDMFINIPPLLRLLKEQQLVKRSMFGRVISNAKPFRNVASKYFISELEYKPSTFPNFLSGAAYLITQDSIHDLYEQALDMPFVRFEDVFITGLVAARIGIRIINTNEFTNQKVSFKTTQIRKTISVHGVTPREQFLYSAATDLSIRTLCT